MGRWLPVDKPDGSPKALPRARTFQTRNSCLSNCWALFWICCEKNLSRCNKSEMVAEKFKSSVQLVRVLPKVIQNLLQKVFGYWNKCYYSESMKLLKKWQQVLERRHSAHDLTIVGAFVAALLCICCKK